MALLEAINNVLENVLHTVIHSAAKSWVEEENLLVQIIGTYQGLWENLGEVYPLYQLLSRGWGWVRGIPKRVIGSI